MKRYIRLAKSIVVILALGCAVMAFCFGNSHAQVTIKHGTARADAAETDPVDSYKRQRAQLRAESKAQLNDIAHNAGTDPEIARQAQQQLIELCAREESELVLEGLLELRGWKQAAVIVGQDSVNVFLRAEAITAVESSMIMDYVCRETGVQSGNIKIIPIN